jgi:pimeloyl-ACP methyl ester carboxylesterase
LFQRLSAPVFGSGPTDLVFVPGFVSHIEAYWDHPDLARWLLRLASFARVAMFDKRGTGLSDRVSELPSFDLRMDDARAVMMAIRTLRCGFQRLKGKAVSSASSAISARWRLCTSELMKKLHFIN